MHTEARDFTLFIKNIFNEYFINKKVLDVGSGDINGNNRFLFENCEYHGNDVIQAPNVTIVSKTKDLPFDNNCFDTIISTECFEHDPEYVLSFKKIYDMLKPYGLYVFTCASTGRAEHGTRRANNLDSYGCIGGIEDMQDYYKNLTITDINNIHELDKVFIFWKSYYNSTTSDLYFFGIKRYNISDELFNNTTIDINIIKKLLQQIDYVNDKIHEFNKIQYENNANIFCIDNKTKLNELSSILIKYHTDKNYFFHNYGRQYDEIFNKYKNKSINVLELGVWYGESLKIYLEYFKNCNKIVGIDINPNSLQYGNDKINIEILDLRDINTYEIIKNKYQNFDIIIDDGSHQNTDMILSFENLFNILNDGGVYIIEDTVVYKHYNWNDYTKPNILDYIYQYTKFLNQWRYDSDIGIKDHCADPFKIYKKTNNTFEYSIDKIEYGCSYIAIYKKTRNHWID